jgi:membrane protein
MKKSIISFIKELYNIWISERPNILAAALAYFGMFQKVENLLGADLAQYIQNAIYNLSEMTTTGASFWSSAIAFLALLFAASGLFFQLQHALNTIWRVPPLKKNGTTAFLRQRLFSFVMVIGVGLLLVMATLANIILSWLGTLLPILSDIPYLNSLSFLGFVTLSFALIYKILPDADVAWRYVWLASALTAVLMALGGKLLELYMTGNKFGSAFEAAGAVDVILISIYFFAQIFLLGAVFTRVYAHIFGSKIEEEI